MPVLGRHLMAHRRGPGLVAHEAGIGLGHVQEPDPALRQQGHDPPTAARMGSVNPEKPTAARMFMA
jgi:hypothetical protein